MPWKLARIACGSKSSALRLSSALAFRAAI
jgi:hypothetical protein